MSVYHTPAVSKASETASSLATPQNSFTKRTSAGLRTSSVPRNSLPWRSSVATRTSFAPRSSSMQRYSSAPRISAAPRPSVRPSARTSTLVHNQISRMSRRMTAEDFKGLFAPVLACFNDDEIKSLNVDYIDKYAAWLRREKIQGICVNSIIGEGPALGFVERQLHIEAWWSVAYKYDLLTIVQVGGVPLYDVLRLAEHAEKLAVHAVLCLPELFFKPTTVNELVGYCKIVAKKCPTRPFLYYHSPQLTNIDLDMSEFCDIAELAIPNFLGILYKSPDLDVGSRCIRPGRVVMLGSSLLLASGLLMGFETFMCSFLTVRPDLGHAIINAMSTDNLKMVTKIQQQLNEIIFSNVNKSETKIWMDSIKYWFNQESKSQRGPRIPAGPIRSFYLPMTI